MCFYDLEMPEFCESFIHKARKVHKCDECRREIKPKEHYKKIIGKWNGDFQVWKQCEGCQDLIQTIEEIEKSHGCGWEDSSPGLGDLYNAIKDCPEARNKLLPMII